MDNPEFEPFEDLSRYPVQDEKRERMFAEQLECSVVWTTSDGWPVGVIQWFVWRDSRIWVTTHTRRKRLSAFRARPETCVIVSSCGTSLGPAQTVTVKTRATVHTDQQTKDWFHRALADKAYPHDAEYREFFHRMLHETDRVVIELDPVQWISYDAMRMHADIQSSDIRVTAPEDHT